MKVQGCKRIRAVCMWRVLFVVCATQHKCFQTNEVFGGQSLEGQTKSKSWWCCFLLLHNLCCKGSQKWSRWTSRWTLNGVIITSDFKNTKNIWQQCWKRQQSDNRKHSSQQGYFQLNSTLLMLFIFFILCLKFTKLTKCCRYKWRVFFVHVKYI